MKRCAVGLCQSDEEDERVRLETDAHALFSVFRLSCGMRYRGEWGNANDGGKGKGGENQKEKEKTGKPCTESLLATSCLVVEWSLAVPA